MLYPKTLQHILLTFCSIHLTQFLLCRYQYRFEKNKPT